MAKLTTNGQVTIPKGLRDHLGLNPASDIDFALAEDGRVFLKIHPEAPESRFAAQAFGDRPGGGVVIDVRVVAFQSRYFGFLSFQWC